MTSFFLISKVKDSSMSNCSKDSLFGLEDKDDSGRPELSRMTCFIDNL